MARFNHVTLLGNLTAKGVTLADRPGTDRNGNPMQVATFMLVVNDRPAQGQKDGHRNVIPVKCWNGLARTTAEYVVGGQEVLVSGRIRTSEYEQDGQKRYGWEVVADEIQFLRRPNGAGAPASAELEGATTETEAAESGVPASASDDDIPF